MLARWLRTAFVAMAIGLQATPGAYAMGATNPTDALACGPGWTLVPSQDPAQAFYATLYGVSARAGNDVWAVGTFNAQLGDPFATLIEHYGGGSWGIEPSPDPGAAANSLRSVVGIAADDAWAVGYAYEDPTSHRHHPLVERWDGVAWTNVEARAFTPEAELLGVDAVYPDDVWAVGRQADDAYTGRTLAMHWNGRRWSVVPTPTPVEGITMLVAVDALAPDDVWAVGRQGQATEGSTLIEHWDGSTWSVVPSPNVAGHENELTGVAAVSPDDVWAVGWLPLRDNKAEALIEHWDGVAWTIVPAAPVHAQAHGLFGVAAVSPHDVEAVGFVERAPGALTFAERWDGSAWERVSSEDRGNSDVLEAVATAPGGSLWAVGTSWDSHAQRYRTLVECRCAG